MAKSGTFSKQYGGGWTFSVDWKVTSQSPANLTSTIQVTAYLICAPTYDLYKSARSTVSFYLDDVIEPRHVSVEPISTQGGETIKLGSTTLTAKHDSAGAQSVWLYANWGVYANLAGEDVKVMDAGQTVTLDPLFTASQPSLITWPETTNDVGDFGDTISIHMNRQSSELTHTVRYEFGTRSGTIATGVTTGTTWTIPLAFINDLPSTTKGSGRIYVDTYHGSAFIGTKYTGFTATVPASVKPSCTMTLDDVTGIDDIYGSPVQSLSRVKVTVNPSTAYGSPIKSYSISIDGVKYTKAEATTNPLRSAGDSVVTVSVTDQRGRTGTASYTMKVQAYTGPAITSLAVHRCNADGSANDQGEYVKATFSAAVSSMNSKNTAAYALRYKKSSATTYTSVTFSALANKYAVTEYSYIFAADSNSSYDIEVDATDRHSTTTRATSASTAFTLINWGANGTSMAVGKVAEGDHAFEVGLDTYHYGSTIQRGNRYAFSSPGVANSEGFVLMARISVTAANADTPLTFVFTQRRALAPMTVHITLTNATATSSAVNKVVYEGANYDAYLSEVDGLTWDLYVKKATAYDTITLQDWWTSKTMESRVEVIFPGTLAETVPTPFWKATPAQLESLRDYIYPVGSVYICWSHVSPATLFGGTWVRIENAFLWGCDADGAIGLRDGEKKHTLTVDELPSHTHGSVYSGNVSGTKTHAWLASGGSAMAYGTIATGGGAAHNNMPPFVQVSIWRRTA